MKDISKLFTDYTELSVPASTKNNKAFKRYYNADIDEFSTS